MKECVNRMAFVCIHQRLQSPSWTQILNTTFRRRTDRLIHRICLRLRKFGALWQQPFMPTPSLSHCKHWSTVSEKHGNQFLCQHFKILSVRCLTDWKQSLKTMEIPFHTNSEHGHGLFGILALFRILRQRHRLTLSCHPILYKEREGSKSERG